MTDKILHELVAKGVSGEVIIEVAKLIADVEHLKTEVEASRIARENHAAYMREWRASRPVKSRDFTVKSRDFTDAPLKEKKVRKEGRKTKIAVDWVPAETDRACARREGWSDQRIDHETKRFRNYYRANGKAMENWSPKWENWVTSAYQNAASDGARGSPAGTLPRPGSREDRQERTANAIAKLSEYIDAKADDAREGGSPREAPAGQLPFPKLARS